jgi:TatD DNase family protein
MNNNPPPPLFDAHNHLQDERLRPHRATVFADLARLGGVRGAVINGTGEHDWAEVARLAAEHAWIVPSFGLHPWRVRERSSAWLEKLQEYLDATGPRAIAGIGEIGLDRWIKHHDIDDQRAVFVAQLRLATARNTPVTIHCLQAWDELADVLHDEPTPARGFLVHAYGGPSGMAGPLAKRGAYFSFNGYFLHARKEARREIFRSIPIDRLLVETDAPDMSPPPEHAPFSLPAATQTPGSREGDSDNVASLNHPANLAETYRALAELRGMSLEALAAQVEKNFQRLFGETLTPP